jgi:hypothetical protein
LKFGFLKFDKLFFQNRFTVLSVKRFQKLLTSAKTLLNTRISPTSGASSFSAKSPTEEISPSGFVLKTFSHSSTGHGSIAHWSGSI